MKISLFIAFLFSPKKKTLRKTNKHQVKSEIPLDFIS